MTLGVFIGIAQFLLTIFIGIISYLLKRNVGRMDEDVKANHSKVENINEKISTLEKAQLESLAKVQKDLYDFKIHVNEAFVTKRDYSATVGDIANKIDKMYDIMLDLKGRVYHDKSRND